MLQVSIHAGPPSEAVRFNRLAWVEISYEKLAPIADYKAILFQNGYGASMPAPIYDYPHWSGSLWDLVARAIAIGLRADEDCLNEEVPPIHRESKQFAFANRICAFIEHTGMFALKRKYLVGTEIEQFGRKRGTYIAQFAEHTIEPHVTGEFRFLPSLLRPAELLLHACLMRLSGTLEFPPRPALCVPPSITYRGAKYVPIHQLTEPARTGLLNWLEQVDAQPIKHPRAPQGIVTETLYLDFLRKAI